MTGQPAVLLPSATRQPNWSIKPWVVEDHDPELPGGC
jgi:hypothetical protein